MLTRAGVLAAAVAHIAPAGEASQSQRPIGYSIEAWAAAIRAIGTR
jgi:hypothetical protein